MLKRPKTRVKTPKGKKARSKVESLPPGTYEMTINPRGLFAGSIIGRIDGHHPSKPLEKMSKKELIDAFDKFRKHHDSQMDTRRLQLEAKDREITVLNERISRSGYERDDAMRTRDSLLEIMRFGAQEGSFPRNS